MDSHHRFTQQALERLQGLSRDQKAELKRAKSMIKKQREVIADLENDVKYWKTRAKGAS